MITLNLCGLNTTRIDGNTTKLKSTHVGVDFGSKILFGTESFFPHGKIFVFTARKTFLTHGKLYARKIVFSARIFIFYGTENSFYGTEKNIF